MLISPPVFQVFTDLSMPNISFTAKRDVPAGSLCKLSTNWLLAEECKDDGGARKEEWNTK